MRRPSLGPLGALAGTVACVAIAAWQARRHLLIVTVSGDSMRPAYRDGERLLAVRSPAAARVGSVVVAESPDRETLTWPERAPATAEPVLLIKRVAATAGDPVPHGAVTGLAADRRGRVPAGRVVLLGDNAAASFDSRQVGYFPADRVVAVVVRRLCGGGARAHRTPGDRPGTPKKEGDR
ncbi:S24/S26 family peptidase [Nonomuraea sp. K274]|uniref:S24/S26 family peptidase n=1 Tax=Nonomuraea cypriaca TaxID=1187855 RepID=A0A931AL77_9ACTN|nr:S26 family signal peptidase [Nonomuraea cypriaca]MBF8191042.1 S24/S26 family peptidase [Nonomuraea cypriaca]